MQRDYFEIFTRLLLFFSNVFIALFSSVDYSQAGSITVVAWQDQSLLGAQEMHPSQANEVNFPE